MNGLYSCTICNAQRLYKILNSLELEIVALLDTKTYMGCLGEKNLFKSFNCCWYILKWYLEFEKHQFPEITLKILSWKRRFCSMQRTNYQFLNTYIFSRSQMVFAFIIKISFIAEFSRDPSRGSQSYLTVPGKPLISCLNLPISLEPRIHYLASIISLLIYFHRFGNSCQAFYMSLSLTWSTPLQPFTNCLCLSGPLFLCILN